MGIFKKGDKLSRKPAYIDKYGWPYGSQIMTVREHISSGLYFEEDPPGCGGWGSMYFDLLEAAPPSTPAGRKDDSGKLDMTLLDDMPNALEAVVEVMQWAITKKVPVPYERGSWLGVHADRYRAAILRHRTAAAKQAALSGEPARFERDEETNLLHLAHEACSALMALENALRELKKHD